jgi:glycosyltransferase involved in cell wall biosynthesis
MKLAILADYREENWPSMDLAAEMLTRELQAGFGQQIDARQVCPEYRRRASRIVNAQAARNADRLFNRLRDYPRFAATIRDDFDLFHVVDHSYSQLLHSLPAERTGVYCHDLDTFRCILLPDAEPRPRWFRAMTRHILRGFQKAAIVFHSTCAIRQQIIEHSLIDPAKLVHAPLGIAPEFSPESPGDVQLPVDASRPFVLHVGSCIARKRIDVLLDVLARLDGDVRLIQVGGEWTPAQRAQIDRLKIGDRIRQLRGISRNTLAELYRRARVVLLTSEAEGFGLPLVEALACGAPVIASDIPVLREVGGAAATFCAVGDIDSWTADVNHVLANRLGIDRAARLARASKYTWHSHAETILNAYLNLGGR